ncbi:MAG: hypothetical protein ACR2M3_03235 [Thermomicrobiales bacterium]
MFNVDDAELLTLIASADDHAFTEFVDRYAEYVVALESRILDAMPPTDLSVAVFSKIRTLAGKGPKDSAAVKEWVLDLALAASLGYKRGTQPDSTRINEDARRNLARQIEGKADLSRQIEEYIAHHDRATESMPGVRIGIARGRYTMTPAFDDPLPEFEAYE